MHFGCDLCCIDEATRGRPKVNAMTKPTIRTLLLSLLFHRHPLHLNCPTAEAASGPGPLLTAAVQQME